MNPLNTNQKPMNFMQLYSQAVQNPKAFFSQLGLPENISTPQQAVQYLLQSGRVSQAQVNQAQQMAGKINR